MVVSTESIKLLAFPDLLYGVSAGNIVFCKDNKCRTRSVLGLPSHENCCNDRFSVYCFLVNLVRHDLLAMKPARGID